LSESILGFGFGTALNWGQLGGNFGGIWRIANLQMFSNINKLLELFGSRLAHHFSFLPNPGTSKSPSKTMMATKELLR